jgi:hypothetical protein
MATRLAALAVLVISSIGFAQQQPGSPPPVPPSVPEATGSLPPPSVLPDAIPQPVPAVPTAPQAAPSPGSTAPQPGTPLNGMSAQPTNTLMSGLMSSQLTPVPRFNFKIDPNTSTKDLLPTPPKTKAGTGPLLADDLTKVPEVEFQARPENITAGGKLTEQTAHQLAKISHLNAKKTDAFMTALLENRPDLAGLPFAMGDDCRTSGERTKQFTIAVSTVRQALGGGQLQFNFNTVGGVSGPVPPGAGSSVGQAPQALPARPGQFWPQFVALCDQQDAALPRGDKALAEHVTLARIAALSQMLAPESAEMRLGLVKYLTGVPHVEATRALARLAIFSNEDDVRQAAIDSLKVRREKDYTDILLKALRHPWPAVAKRSAEAIARTGRTDLIPELVAVLDESDPRLPATKQVDGKKVAVVRELVKVNHHRNCMMCHSPADTEKGSGHAIIAEVPVQDQALPSPSQGYRQSSVELMIRVDVTYLRQDFSAMMAVADSGMWPEMQRFDFLVRERKLTAEEADAYREKLTPKEAGVLTPYHKAAVAALREITGKDTGPTAEAWRELLKLQSH